MVAEAETVGVCNLHLRLAAHFFRHIVANLLQGGFTLAFLQLLQQVIGEETMPFLFIGIGRFVARSRTEDDHVALRFLRFGFQGHTTCRSQHVTIASCTAEAGIQEYNYRIGIQSRQLGIEFVQRIAHFRLLPVGVNRKKKSVFGSFIGHTMSRIVEDDINLARVVHLGDVLQVLYGGQHDTVGSVWIVAHIRFRQSQCLAAILAKRLSVVLRRNPRWQ